MTDEYSYRGDEKDDGIYIDIRRSKGNTDELEKITRDHSGLVIYIKLKEAATKKLRLRVFSRRILVCLHKQRLYNGV